MKKSVLFILIFILSLNETICFAQINEEKNWEWANVIITEETNLDSLPDTVRNITSSLYKAYNDKLKPEDQKKYDKETLVVLKGNLIVYRQYEDEITYTEEEVGYVYFIGIPGSNQINDAIIWISLKKSNKIKTNLVLNSIPVFKIDNSNYVYGIYGSITEIFTLGGTDKISGFEDNYYGIVIPKITSN